MCCVVHPFVLRGRSVSELAPPVRLTCCIFSIRICDLFRCALLVRLSGRLSRQIAASNAPTSSEASAGTESVPSETREGEQERERETLSSRSMRLEPTPDDAKVSKRHGLRNLAAYMVDRAVRACSTEAAGASHLAVSVCG
jgi:hypothetical protein